MKYLIFVAVLSLTACAAEESASPAAAEMPARAADGAEPDGLYRAVDETGLVLIEELNADGTYVFKDEANAVLEEGTYIQKSPAELCFTANSEGASEKCYDEAIGDDGVWRSTDRETGVAAVIERITVSE